ncbi:hypothetical protein B0H13DRAFT_1917049 [Mycena leptocephala]|nr:hypothetical protein B0H13DRAFT_1917049 [Mycena leptocephala]
MCGRAGSLVFLCAVPVWDAGATGCVLREYPGALMQRIHSAGREAGVCKRARVRDGAGNCKRAYRLCERDVCVCARSGDGADADACGRGLRGGDGHKDVSAQGGGMSMWRSLKLCGSLEARVAEDARGGVFIFQMLSSSNVDKANWMNINLVGSRTVTKST